MVGVGKTDGKLLRWKGAGWPRVAIIEVALEQMFFCFFFFFSFWQGAVSAKPNPAEVSFHQVVVWRDCRDWCESLFVLEFVQIGVGNFPAGRKTRAGDESAPLSHASISPVLFFFWIQKWPIWVQSEEVAVGAGAHEK